MWVPLVEGTLGPNDSNNATLERGLQALYSRPVRWGAIAWVVVAGGAGCAGPKTPPAVPDLEVGSGGDATFVAFTDGCNATIINGHRG